MSGIPKYQALTDWSEELTEIEISRGFCVSK
jgi:hypothetical protein